MRLKVKTINFESGNTKYVILNSKDAQELGSKVGERLIIKDSETESVNNKYIVAILQIATSDAIVAPGELGIFNNLKHLIQSTTVSVKSINPPKSFKYIKKKIKGEKLLAPEINDIISDATSGLLSEIEIASFITSVDINGCDNEEMIALTLAEAYSGEAFDFGPKVFDKHST